MESRAVDQVVAQISNLPYRRASSLRAVRKFRHVGPGGRSADWKSAIQQIGNLRYVLAARRNGGRGDFVNGPGTQSAGP